MRAATLTLKCSPEHLRWGRQYVGDRLRTATLDYEETGWYDGATFHKPQEVLVRDRLLAAYEVPAHMAHASLMNPGFEGIYPYCTSRRRSSCVTACWLHMRCGTHTRLRRGEPRCMRIRDAPTSE